MTASPTDPFKNALADGGIHSPADACPDDLTMSLGKRLRQARQAQGWELESCAHALKLSSKVLSTLESDAFDGTDHQVYLASYITKYGRYLGLDESVLRAEVSRLQKSEPALVASGGISHTRYLLERYATAATYLVLTAVIIVPVIWLGVRGTLDRDISHLSPLDAAPVAQQDARQPAGRNTTTLARSASMVVPRIVPSATDNEQPLLASMVPNLVVSDAPVIPAVNLPMDSGSGEHSLGITLTQPSWVEVVGADGKRLEYSLLGAGSNKTYHSDQSLEVRLGNATGATVQLDGKPVPLDDYRRANVARFQVKMTDGKAVLDGG